MSPQRGPFLVFWFSVTKPMIRKPKPSFAFFGTVRCFSKSFIYPCKDKGKTKESPLWFFLGPWDVSDFLIPPSGPRSICSRNKAFCEHSGILRLFDTMRLIEDLCLKKNCNQRSWKLFFFRDFLVRKFVFQASRVTVSVIFGTVELIRVFAILVEKTYSFFGTMWHFWIGNRRLSPKEIGFFDVSS